jgi:hypothetical protein
MKFWLAKVQRDNKIGLIATDDQGRAYLQKLANGECIQADLVRPRSLPMHKRFFAILNDIGDNQDPPRDVEDILDELKVLAGHYSSMYIHDPKTGEMFEVRRPKSIAFHRLDHDEWMKIYPSLEQAGIERFGMSYWFNEAAA